MDRRIDLTERRYFRSNRDNIIDTMTLHIESFGQIGNENQLMMSSSVYDDLYDRYFIIQEHKKLEIVPRLALEVDNRFICPRCGRVSIKPSYSELCTVCDKEMDYDLYNPLDNKDIIRNSRYFNI